MAPLDWGLGHATRCIPLIDHLIHEYNAQITIAASGAQRALLCESFPNISFLTPPLYKVKYHKNRAATIAGLVFATPGILRTIRYEATWLKTILTSHRFDAIISDSRYGLSSSTIPSYLITHQLMVKTPFGEVIDHYVQRRLYSLINRFSECWVPDYEKEPSLAGELSHPTHLPGIPIRYLGPLSRLRALQPTSKTQLLVLLSGPEPQRSILEKMVIRQWTARPGVSMVLVRGLPLEKNTLPDITNTRVFNYLSAEELSQEVANASAILCRSGYSSIMDLVPLKKQCFMVPTPGQTEQEYLSRFLNDQGLITAIDQNKLNLSALLALFQ